MRGVSPKALAAPCPAAAVTVGALLLAALPLLAGCDHDTEERNLTNMASEIDHLQVSRDEANREMGADVADSRAAGVPQRMPAPTQPPPPPAVQVGEGPDPDGPDTDDPSPRPTIRVIGSARRGGDVQQVTDDPSGATSPAPGGSSALDPNAKHDYDAALALVNAKKYDAALDALAAFLVKNPDHPYADNALFWRGECFYAKGDYLHAAEQFEGVVTRFPAGNKAPDALLKLGMSRQRMGDPVRAKEAFDRLAQSYPQSDAARRIPPVTMPAKTPSGPEDHR